MLVTVFFLGLVGLGVDRVFLRPQGSVNTVAADPWELLVPADTSGGGDVSDAGMQGAGVAQRLSRLWSVRELDPNNVRDPFCLPVSWYGGSSDGPATVSNEAARFASANPLVALVVDGHRSRALVGEHCLRLGQALDGFTLISVGPQSAVFERGNERIVLELVSQ